LPAGETAERPITPPFLPRSDDVNLVAAISMAAVLVPMLAAFGDDSKTDEKALQGTWEITDAELAGKKLPKGKPITLTMEDGKYLVKAESDDKGTYTLDATKKPKEIDIKGTDGPNKGKTFLAIYELDGDSLKVCYDLAGKERPKEFKTTPGTFQFLATYKRKKP
jgi:uncharacterized protein (TIGR03067 family)